MLAKANRELRMTTWAATGYGRSIRILINLLLWVDLIAWVVVWLWGLLNGQQDVEMATGQGGFVVTSAFGPDTAVVGFNDAPHNGQAQTRPAAFKFGLAAGM